MADTGVRIVVENLGSGLGRIRFKWWLNKLPLSYKFSEAQYFCICKMRVTLFMKLLSHWSAPFLFLTLFFHNWTCFSGPRWSFVPNRASDGVFVPAESDELCLEFKLWVKTQRGGRQFRQSTHDSAKDRKEPSAVTESCRASLSVFPNPVCAVLLIHEPVQRPSNKSFVFM